MRTLADRLKWAREVAGLSARGLDELAKLTPGHTAAIESGRRQDPTLTTAIALARTLGVTLDWLGTGRGVRPSERRIRSAIGDHVPRTGTDG